MKIILFLILVMVLLLDYAGASNISGNNTSSDLSPEIERKNLAGTCTGINVTKNGKTLYGNNEDYYTTTVYEMDFRPAESGKYGRVYWKHVGNPWVQGGMNDKGLAFDGFGTPDTNIIFSAEKLPFNGDLTEKIMEECSSVEEVISIVNQYKFDRLQTIGQFFFVDKTGDSVIIGGQDENDDIDIVRKNRDFQVVTNFFISKPELGGYPCWRYNTAVSMLEDNNSSTIENVRSILDAVHLGTEGSTLHTLYSNIFDLQDGIIYLYKMHNYQERVVFNLNEELQKGFNTYVINNIFSDIKLIYPAWEESVGTGAITFRWEGRSNSSYELYCSEDPCFSDCEPILVNTGLLLISKVNKMWFPFIGVCSIGLFVGIRRRSSLKYFIPLILFFSLLSCQLKNEDIEVDIPNDVIEINHTIDNLETGTTYYWKIEANAIEGFKSKSNVRNFITN